MALISLKKFFPTYFKVLVVKRLEENVTMNEGRDYWVHERPINDEYCEPEPMQSEDTLFYLYTSGSTGKPKDDIFGCMADIGWITGHSYILYGPLCNGSTTVLFESVPTYPSPSRYWQVIDKLKITQLYTAPTVIRVLQRLGDSYLEGFDLSSLRIIGSVGEPIGRDAWQWYHDKVGKGRCAVVDTYWQTETGGIIVTTLPGLKMKPGFAGLPFFGIELDVAQNYSSDNSSQELNEPVATDETFKKGVLVIKRSWPSIARTILNDHLRFKQSYFHTGLYFTGDSVRIDADGYYQILGRVDDVINVSGHRLSTAEIESAVCRHPLIAEAAALGQPDDITGQSIIVFAIQKVDHCNQTDKLNIEHEMKNLVKEAIGPIAHIKDVVFPSDLPKTRSGKIMRRLLRKMVEGCDELGDLSTLNNPQ